MMENKFLFCLIVLFQYELEVGLWKDTLLGQKKKTKAAPCVENLRCPYQNAGLVHVLFLGGN